MPSAREPAVRAAAPQMAGKGFAARTENVRYPGGRARVTLGHLVG